MVETFPYRIFPDKEDKQILDRTNTPSPPYRRPEKRDLSSDESPLVLKRPRVADRHSSLLTLHAQIDAIITQAVALSRESVGGLFQDRYPGVPGLLTMLDPKLLPPPVSALQTRLTAEWFILYHFRIGGKWSRCNRSWIAGIRLSSTSGRRMLGIPMRHNL